MPRFVWPVGLCAVTALAGCTDPQPSTDTGPVTGIVTYHPGYHFGPATELRMELDSDTATLTVVSDGLTPLRQHIDQANDAAMIRALREHDALDGREGEGDTGCVDGDGGSLHLTIADQKITEWFGCGQPGVTADAITAAGFDVDEILDEVRAQF
ncbi:hypothetical protein [Cellulomonas sp. NPDC089187]|uniref:hypothetical protein n=1 Tax=Cellulomonas sp. NPDC089187 TaxID=3154970 RepID=UPI00341742CD